MTCDKIYYNTNKLRFLSFSFFVFLSFLAIWLLAASTSLAFSLPSLPKISSQESTEVGGVDMAGKSVSETAEDTYTGKLAINPEGYTDGIGDPNAPKPKFDDRKITYKRPAEKTKDIKAVRGCVKSNKIDYSGKRNGAMETNPENQPMLENEAMAQGYGETDTQSGLSWQPDWKRQAWKESTYKDSRDNDTANSTDKRYRDKR